MRKTTTLLCICLFCFAAALPATAEVFSPADDAVTMPQMNPEFVLRQRAVRVDREAAVANFDGGLRLNLFEDITLEVNCTTLAEGPAGDRICYGQVDGEVGGRATLVLGEASLAATLVTAEMTYKVRPIDDNWHLVREILPATGGTGPWAATATSDERMVWTLTNQERAEHRLPALGLNGDLVASARAHSADMAAQNYFDHTALDGRSVGDRIAAAGYEAWSWGENIAAGYATPEAVVTGWMNSDGHRANILSNNYCDIGVGYAYEGDSDYHQYWTQNFGRQAGVSECPEVSDDGGNDSGDGGSGGDAGSDSSSGSSGGGCFIGQALEYGISLKR